MPYYKHALGLEYFLGLHGHYCRHPNGSNNLQETITDGFYDEPAGNIMAFSDHSRDVIVLMLAG